MVVETRLDPVKYEIFRHRLWNILQEGRIAIQRVSGSPIVVEGGECVCGLYLTDATNILTTSGVTLHSVGPRAFIRRTIEWYEDDPGINEGDQFFWNDPYIGGAHNVDMSIIKPIFYQGRRIAWTGSIMHTEDTGGVLGQMPTEIFHEGIRILGLKIVEKGEFRQEVFRTIVEQCRDPHLVGLDAKAKIAANNVCARAYLELIKRYGFEFVEAASRKIVEDSELMARAKLRGLPDGVWRSRVYGNSYQRGQDSPYKVVCTVIKKDDEITFDFTGTSPQRESYLNCTQAGSWAMLIVPLTTQLFWDIPWNGGMTAPVRLVVPEGSLLNCRFPASCTMCPASPGHMLTATAHQCIAKMLYAGGHLEEVSAGWLCAVGGGGGGFGRYAGKNQYGSTVAQAIFDFFAAGTGATPWRDGVDSGGHLQNLQSLISDLEIVEMNYPFLHLGRNHLADGGGFGKFSGGMGFDRIMMVYGSENLAASGGLTGKRRPPGGWGLFGGYPPALADGGLFRNPALVDQLKASTYPRSFAELEGSLGEPIRPLQPMINTPLQPFDVLSNRISAGSGYGDPLDRPSERVLQDVRNGAVSIHNALKVYGVVITSEGLDKKAMAMAHRKIREERLREGRRIR